MEAITGFSMAVHYQRAPEQAGVCTGPKAVPEKRVEIPDQAGSVLVGKLLARSLQVLLGIDAGTGDF
jgi:hypothetical protein